jgi:outer membrane biogenesis lipoprotein LolB
MKKLSRVSALLLVAATLLSGCSMLTKQGRQERAYAHYVHKSSLGRVKQQRLFAARGNTMPVTHSAEPVVITEASGPESVSGGSGQ